MDLHKKMETAFNIYDANNFTMKSDRSDVTTQQRD